MIGTQRAGGHLVRILGSRPSGVAQIARAYFSAYVLVVLVDSYIK